jgi:hypothetical protein
MRIAGKIRKYILLRKENPCIVFLLAKHNSGAFFAPQKTGLCGGSAAKHGLRPCAAADGHLRWPRPSNPLRVCGVRPWRPQIVPKHPQGVSIIPTLDT